MRRLAQAPEGIKRNNRDTLNGQGGHSMFQKQERTLAIVCLVVAVIMLYAFIKSVNRFLQYFS